MFINDFCVLVHVCKDLVQIADVIFQLSSRCISVVFQLFKLSYFTQFDNWQTTGRQLEDNWKTLEDAIANIGNNAHS